MTARRSQAADFLPLTHLGFHVLLALVDEPLHGYAMVQRVREASEGRIDPGTGSFYSVIHGLSDQGLIEEVESRGAGGGGDRRRVYALSALGRRVLAADTDRLESLVHEVDRRGVRPVWRKAVAR
jgi:PadR family transcriptional regulator PadR